MSCYFEQSDCFLFLKKQQTATVDLIYIDPPFGTTKNFWDSQLDWKQLFIEFFRVLKPTGMLVIHSSIPFNYELIRAAPKPPSHSWYWNKGGSPSCPLIANVQPLRCVEEILIWKNKKPTYYRQQIGEELRPSSYMTTNHYYGSTTKKGKTWIKGKTRTHYLDMKRTMDGYSTRPREMVELMIDSYSKEGDTVLDCFCYKGLSGAVCKQKGRRWLGCDLYHLPVLLM